MFAGKNFMNACNGLVYSGGGSHTEQGAIQIIRTHLYGKNYIPMEGQ